MMKNHLFAFVCAFLIQSIGHTQSCTPLGNQVTAGTSNVWRGYVYDNSDLTGYRGYFTQGTSGNPNFDLNFGGNNTSFPTNGCSVQTETFSVRFKLNKSFTNGAYDITVGGDDGYRMSFDGGATWPINNWNVQAYTTTVITQTLNGLHQLVIEYYENSGENRISFNIVPSCSGSENTNHYGSGNVWRGYIYDGTAHNTYKGMVTAGTSTNLSFTENFGGDNVMFPTSGCSVQTETFSVRYRLNKTFGNGSYIFVVGGDDGYRLSFDGGLTWPVNQWHDQGYATTTYTVNLHGNYNIVLDYYENGGSNQIGFAQINSVALPVHLLSFTGESVNTDVKLGWDITTSSDPDYFTIERSADGNNFQSIGSVSGTNGINDGTVVRYRYTDRFPMQGTSYYRLRMVDNSTTVTYSRSLLINRSDATQLSLRLFPTLVTEQRFSVSVQQKTTLLSLQIHDYQGRLMHSINWKDPGVGQVLPVHISGKHLAAGVYLVSWTDDQKRKGAQKIVIQ